MLPLGYLEGCEARAICSAKLRSAGANHQRGPLSVQALLLGAESCNLIDEPLRLEAVGGRDVRALRNERVKVNAGTKRALRRVVPRGRGVPVRWHERRARGARQFLAGGGGRVPEGRLLLAADHGCRELLADRGRR